LNVASGQADKERVQKRVETVYRLILQGETIPNICQNLSKIEGVSERTVRRYVARARAMVHAEAKRIREEAFDEHLAARRRMRKEAHDAHDGRLAFDILRDEAKMLELYPAEKQKQEGEIVLRVVRDGTASPFKAASREAMADQGEPSQAEGDQGRQAERQDDVGG